jgi:hypothetical protein
LATGIAESNVTRRDRSAISACGRAGNAMDTQRTRGRSRLRSQLLLGRAPRQVLQYRHLLHPPPPPRHLPRDHKNWLRDHHGRNQDLEARQSSFSPQRRINRVDWRSTRKRVNTFRCFKNIQPVSCQDFSTRNSGQEVSYKRAIRKPRYGMRWWHWELYIRLWRKRQNHHLAHQTTITSTQPQTIITSHYNNMAKL